MKRFVSEFANHVKGKIAIPCETTKRIDEVVSLCSRMYITDFEAVKEIVDIYMQSIWVLRDANE